MSNSLKIVSVVKRKQSLGRRDPPVRVRGTGVFTPEPEGIETSISPSVKDGHRASEEYGEGVKWELLCWVRRSVELRRMCT